MKVVLINPYELGRQPFALAQPAAWRKEAGHQVCCLELSLQQLDDVALGHAELVAVYVGMHTAARIAAEALPRIRALAPQAHVSVYGLEPRRVCRRLQLLRGWSYDEENIGKIFT